MQKSIWMNTLRAASNPSQFIVMLKKIRKRIADTKGSLADAENIKWLRRNSIPLEDYTQKLDPALWEESLRCSAEIRTRAERIPNGIEFDLGGGGAYPLLYFLTRFHRPDMVVETGVAAGFSSSAILTALQANDCGVLHSSDFPYFRIRDPKKYIGIVVDDSLKTRWELYTAGDDKNLPMITSRVKQIDLFHYDSDKSYQGRAKAMSSVSPKLAAKSVVLMDDIQDNSFFADYVRQHDMPYKIFEFEGKYVGMIES